MNRSPHILVVDDDREIRTLLKGFLEKNGFAATAVADGEETRRALARGRFDLVVLDLMLPRESGLDICKELRATSELPIIMLTALGDEVDRVVGFEVGADDYVTKPFSVRELMLRVRAIMRRLGGPGLAGEAQRLQNGELEIDVSSHRVWVRGEEVRLTALEFRLLSTMLSRAGRVQTRDTLLSDVWGMHAGLTTRTVDTHVTRLRKKLGEVGNYIETLRGVGYRFRDLEDIERLDTEQLRASAV
jgi:two-component system phosphate regulon response regulator PhoB